LDVDGAGAFVAWLRARRLVAGELEDRDRAVVAHDDGASRLGLRDYGLQHDLGAHVGEKLLALARPARRARVAAPDVFEQPAARLGPERDLAPADQAQLRREPFDGPLARSRRRR
jgi:hypothetical protein